MKDILYGFMQRKITKLTSDKERDGVLLCFIVMVLLRPRLLRKIPLRLNKQMGLASVLEQSSLALLTADVSSLNCLVLPYLLLVECLMSLCPDCWLLWLGF